MSPTRRPNGSPALFALQEAGVDYVLRRYEADTKKRYAYGTSTARRLGLDPRRVFKTLMAQASGGLVCAVVPAVGSLDLKALAQAMRVKKATMAEVAAAERATGYLVGGISPLGQRQAHPTVIDVAAQEYPTIFVSAGARGANIEIAPSDLARLTGARFAAIARD